MRRFELQTEVMPFCIVMDEIRLQCLVDLRHVQRHRIEAFLLHRPVESLDVGIVIRLPHP